MKIIKKRRNRNEYLLSRSGYWVRDLYGAAKPLDINKFTRREDRKLLMDNEMAILSMQVPEIGSNHLPFIPKAVIVSDGYRFEQKQSLLHNLPVDVKIIGTNRSLAKWQVDERGIAAKKMDYYFVNNPYPECMSFMPKHRYRPQCICSLRTHTTFVKKYSPNIYYYVPTPEPDFGATYKGVKPLDDYRNPICGAISFAAKCRVRKLLLFCCDNSFLDARPGAEELSNGLWMYPQHRVPQGIIDGMLYWMRNKEDDIVEIRDHSSGLVYEHAPYIDEEDIRDYFND